jgi:hypothetical protein
MVQNIFCGQHIAKPLENLSAQKGINLTWFQIQYSKYLSLQATVSLTAIFIQRTCNCKNRVCKHCRILPNYVNKNTSLYCTGPALEDGRESDNPERIGGTEVLHSQTRAEVGISRISHSTWCQNAVPVGAKCNAAKHTKQKTWETRGNFLACRPFYFLEGYVKKFS